MSKTNGLAIVSIAFLASGVALLLNDWEWLGIGAILFAAVIAAEISELDK